MQKILQNLYVEEKFMADEVKFERFYYKPTDKVLSISVLVNYDKKYGDIGSYKNNIYCPECHVCPLTYVKKLPHPYLKTKNKCRHSEDPKCSYSFEEAKNNIVIKYYGSLTDQQIQSKLESMMRSLFNVNLNANNSPRQNNNNSNDFLIPPTSDKNNIIVQKRLRTKSLNTWLDQSELKDKIYLFYGKVRLREHEFTSKKNNVTYYSLQILTKNVKGEFKVRTSIFRGKIKDNYAEAEDYYLVAIGHFEYTDNGWPEEIHLIKHGAFSIARV